MKVHHLDCGTMCPRFGKLLVNETGVMPCHCLLVESPAGLILVDTGYGLGDVADPKRIHGMLRFTGRPRLVAEGTAARQIERLGFKLADVKHIVVTHLDVDHAGGILDFPGATVHCLGREHDAAVARKTANERRRYVPVQWEGAKWNLVKEDGEGDRWLGFEGVRQPIAGLGEVLLVPLFGHTRGHCGVAVRTPGKWLLHCGDAYFYHQEVRPEKPRCTFALSLFQSIMQVDGKARHANRDRLQALARDRASEVRVFCAHDPTELAALAAASASEAGRSFA